MKKINMSRSNKIALIFIAILGIVGGSGYVLTGYSRSDSAGILEQDSVQEKAYIGERGNVPRNLENPEPEHFKPVDDTPDKYLPGKPPQNENPYKINDARYSDDREFNRYPVAVSAPAIKEPVSEAKQRLIAAKRAPLAVQAKGLMPGPEKKEPSLKKPLKDNFNMDLNPLVAAYNANRGLQVNPISDSEYKEQNDQRVKKEFAEGQDQDDIVFPRQKPLSSFQVSAGSVIPCILQTGVNSDLPGIITAMVARDVYDSVKGQYLLIPQGTKAVGEYSSDISFGQTRVLIAFNRLILPDGSNIDIGKMGGYGQEGYAGFGDKVNNHFLRMFGSALLMSVIATGAHAITNEKSTNTVRNAFSDSIANQATTLGNMILKKHLNSQPTLVIRPGFEFNIMAQKTIFFKEPY